MYAIYKQMSQLLSSILDAAPDDITALPQLAVLFTQAIWAHCGQRYLGMEFKFWLVEQPDMIFAYELPNVPNLSHESLDAVQQVIQVIRASAAPCNDDTLRTLQDLIQAKCKDLAPSEQIHEEPAVTESEALLAVSASKSTALKEHNYESCITDSKQSCDLPKSHENTPDLSESQEETSDHEESSKGPTDSSGVTVDAVPVIVKLEADENVEEVTGIPQELLDATNEIEALEFEDRREDSTLMQLSSASIGTPDTSLGTSNLRTSKRRRTMTQKMRESVALLGSLDTSRVTQKMPESVALLGSLEIPPQESSSMILNKKSHGTTISSISEAQAIAEALENGKTLRVRLVKLELAEEPDIVEPNDQEEADEFDFSHQEVEFFCVYCNDAFDMVGNKGCVGLQSAFSSRPALRKHVAREHMARSDQSRQLTCPMCAHHAASSNGDEKQVCNRILRHIRTDHGVVFCRGGPESGQENADEPGATQKKHLLQGAAFKCIFCKEKAETDVMFASRLELRHHIQDQHVDMDEVGHVLTCPICHSRHFRSKSMDMKQIANRALRHIEADHPTAINGVFVVKEEEVWQGQPEAQRSSTKRIKYSGPHKGKYFCLECTKAKYDEGVDSTVVSYFTADYLLEDHIASAHVQSDDEGPHIPCPICSCRFNVIEERAARAVRAQLRHQREVHSVRTDCEESIRKAANFQKQRGGTKRKRHLANSAMPEEPDETLDTHAIGNAMRAKLEGPSFSPDGDKYYCVECVMNWDGKLLDEDRHTEPFHVRVALLKHISSCHFMQPHDATPHLVCPVCRKSLSTHEAQPLRGAMRLTRHLREIHGIGLWSEAGMEKLKQDWPTREAIAKSTLTKQDDFTEQDESLDPEDLRTWKCMFCIHGNTPDCAVLESRKALEEHIVQKHCDILASGSCKLNCPDCDWKGGTDRRVPNVMAANFVEHCIITHNVLYKGIIPKNSMDFVNIATCEGGVRVGNDTHARCFMCGVDSAKFENTDSYLHHIREAHITAFDKDEWAITCSLCQFRLVRHRSVLDTPGPGDHIRSCLLQHMVKTHGIRVPSLGRAYRCERCGWETLVMRRYESHLRAVHGKKMASKQPFRRAPADEQPKVQCGDCFKWMTAYSLSLHGQFCAAVARLAERRRRYPCNLCPKAYFQQHVLNAHVRTFHKKERNHLCAMCGTGCFNPHALVRHSWIRHKVNLTSDPAISCAECGEQVPPRLMNLHARLHRKRAFHCPTCGATQSGIRAYKQHLQMHEEHALWRCDLCSYTCDPRSGYPTVHMARAHNINRHECELCRHVTTSEELLNRHKKVAHPEGDVKLHYCALCRKQLSTKSAYQNHMFVRHQLNISQRPVLSCHVCGFETLGHTLLKAHMTKHKGQSYPCNECGKLFKTKSICHEHYKRIHGERKYSCDLCTFSTRMRPHLQRHVSRVHRPESYTCPYCLFTTYVASRYKNHLRQKHGVGREQEEEILKKLMSNKPEQLILGKAPEEEASDLEVLGFTMEEADLLVFPGTSQDTHGEVNTPPTTSDRPEDYTADAIILEAAGMGNDEEAGEFPGATEVMDGHPRSMETDLSTGSVRGNSSVASTICLVNHEGHVLTNTMEPDVGDVTMGPDVGDVTMGPDVGDVTMGPAVADITMGPDVGDVTIGPAVGNVTIGPTVGDVTIGPTVGDITNTEPMGTTDIILAQSMGPMKNGANASDMSSSLGVVMTGVEGPEKNILGSIATVTGMNETAQNVIFIDSSGTVQNLMATDYGPSPMVTDSMATATSGPTEPAFITLQSMAPGNNVVHLESMATPTELMAAETLEILSEFASSSSDALTRDPHTMTSRDLIADSVVTVTDAVSSQAATSGLITQPVEGMPSMSAFTNPNALANMAFGMVDQPSASFSSVDGATVHYLSMPDDAGPETVVLEEVIDPQPHSGDQLEDSPNVQYIYITQELPPQQH